MSSCRRSISETLIATALILLSVAQPGRSEEVDSKVKDAVKCIRMAILSVADQESETADTIASYSLETCHKYVDEAGKRFHQILIRKGNDLSEAEHRLQLKDLMLRDAKRYVIEARAVAKKLGPDGFKLLAMELSGK